MARTIDLLLGSDHRGLELKEHIMNWVNPDDEKESPIPNRRTILSTNYL